MTPAVTLAIGGASHGAVRRHLFSDDGREAVALLVCSLAPGPRRRLIVRDVIPVPHDECFLRAPDRLVWPGKWLERAIDTAMPSGHCVVAIHSHPSGQAEFSDADDASDARTIRSLFAAGGSVHGSAIMLPDGCIRARVYDSNLVPRPVDQIAHIGDDIDFWLDYGAERRACRPLAYTSGMRRELAGLTAAVIGVSGIGSIVTEMLARLGFGRIILVDFDRVKRRNLDRIVNATPADLGRLKVDVVADAIARQRGCEVAVRVPMGIHTREAVLAVSQADVLFSCPDRLLPRQIADRAAAAFGLPLFDAGVSIPTRKAETGRAIADVAVRIDYVQPGGSTLADRSVYSPEKLRAEYLRDSAPDVWRDEVNRGYIKGLPEAAPSVITLNGRAAAALVEEFLARAFPYRLEPNSLRARTRMSLAACEEEHFAEESFTRGPNSVLASGDLEPLLGLPDLGAPAPVAA